MITYIAIAVLLAVIIYSKDITNLFVLIIRKAMTRNSDKTFQRASIPSTIS